MGINNHTQIKTFSEIEEYILPTTLLIIDLDNTLFNYGFKCAIQTDKLIEQTKDPLQLNLLIPKINDLFGFNKLQIKAKLTNSETIFLTARTRSQQVATRTILSKYKIFYPVLYAGNIPKGEYLIDSNVKLDKFTKIICIDDLDKNLDSIIQIKDKIQIPIQTFKFTN